jgi:cytochrome c556
MPLQRAHFSQLDEFHQYQMVLDMIQEAKDLGALMHFAKPFDIDEIRQAVRNELGTIVHVNAFFHIFYKKFIFMPLQRAHFSQLDEFHQK